MVSTNNSLSPEHRSMIFFLENIPASQTLWNEIAKTWWLSAFFFLKNKHALLQNQWLHSSTVNKAFDSLQRKPDEPKKPKTEHWHAFSWQSNAVCFEATVRISSVKVSVLVDNILYKIWFNIHIFSSHSFFTNLIDLNCQKFCICVMVLYIRTNFFQRYRLHFFTNMSITKF